MFHLKNRKDTKNRVGLNTGNTKSHPGRKVAHYVQHRIRLKVNIN